MIYGRKFGTALTMDVFTPKAKPQRRGHRLGGQRRVPFRARIDQSWPTSGPLLERGYTVFAVVHGSQPQFTVPEIIQDINRAVRFIRYHAKDYGIDTRPDRNLRCLGGRPSLADARHRRQTRRPECQVRRWTASPAACRRWPASSRRRICSTTAQPGKEMIHATDHGMPFRPAFDYRELDKKTNVWVPITDTGAAARDHPADLADHAREPRRPAHADHPRRCRRARPASAIRVVREEAQKRGRPDQAGRQEEGRPWVAGHRQGYVELWRIGSIYISRKPGPEKAAEWTGGLGLFAIPGLQSVPL